jgi:hypothetical protein
VNDAFLRTYGYTNDELVGGSIDIVRSRNNPATVTDKILVGRGSEQEKKR